jgi:hypothetical protein
MDQVYGSRDLDWLSAHGGLTTLGQPGHSGAQKVIMIARRERERRSSGFSPLAPLGGITVEMTTRRRSTEATDGALMERWFWA